MSWLRTPEWRSGAANSFFVAVLVLMSLALSIFLACATPFAAMATLAAARLGRSEAVALMLTAWLGNQVIGYGLLGYPWTADSVGWGVMIGIAVIGATTLARMTVHRLADRPWLAMTAAFAVALVAYELVLLLGTLVLPTGGDAFSPAVVGWILWLNLLFLAGFTLVLRGLASVGAVAAASAAPSRMAR